MDELVERARRADRNSVQRMNGSRIFGELADRIERQEAEIRSLREQVAKERAGIVAYIKRSLIEEYCPAAAEEQEAWWYANAIERHEDKEPQT